MLFIFWCSPEFCLHWTARYIPRLGRRDWLTYYEPSGWQQCSVNHCTQMGISKVMGRHSGRSSMLVNFVLVKRNQSSPFRNWSFRESNRQPLTSQVGEITKSSLGRTHCKMWVCFFDWELEGTGADAIKYLLHLSSTASPTSELSSKARLPYACCITGYTTTPPNLTHVPIEGPVLFDSVALRTYHFFTQNAQLQVAPWSFEFLL